MDENHAKKTQIRAKTWKNKKQKKNMRTAETGAKLFAPAIQRASEMSSIINIIFQIRIQFNIIFQIKLVSILLWLTGKTTYAHPLCFRSFFLLNRIQKYDRRVKKWPHSASLHIHK